MTAETQNSKQQTVTGRVEKLFFQSPKFTAGRLSVHGQRPVSFNGAVFVQEGEDVTLRGEWTVDVKYGRQFAAADVVFDLPVDVEGLTAFLANNPAFRGIGPARARQIAVAFCKGPPEANNFERMLDDHPEDIARVAHVHLSVVENLRTEWIAKRSTNAVSAKLSGYGLTHHQVKTLVTKLGNSVLTMLHADPYAILGELDGFGFARTDQIALKMGKPKADPSRIAAGILYAVSEASDHGDTYVERAELVRESMKLLTLDTLDAQARVKAAIEGAIAKGDLVCIDRPAGGESCITTEKLWDTEREIARWIGEHSEAANPHGPDEKWPALPGGLLPGQQGAVLASLLKQIVLISGGAGTGKTYMVKTIADLYEGRKLAVRLCAPTGKAAKRLHEATGRHAQTIHRLLNHDGKQFNAGPENPIDADVVVVDEMSMVDVVLFWNFLRSVDWKRTAVVLVGDHNQLPPVGAGNVLRDLIHRKPVTSIVLDQVVRQAGTLKVNSVGILAGKVAKTADKEAVTGELLPDGTVRQRSPWVVVDQFKTPEDVRKFIVEMFGGLLSERMGFDVMREVQLLSPTKKGPIGTEALDVELQRLVQGKLYGVTAEPPAPGKRPAFLLNDRVIQMKNDYKLDVMNGEIGIVTGIGPDDSAGLKAGQIKVTFEDGNEPTFEREQQQALSLAYALTIHKYQGSEIPCAVVVAHKAHSFMHHRNLLYTAVTRAKKTCIVIGDAWGLRNCAVTQQVDSRKTFLSWIEFPKAPKAPKEN